MTKKATSTVAYFVILFLLCLLAFNKSVLAKSEESQQSNESKMFLKKFFEMHRNNASAMRTLSSNYIFYDKTESDKIKAATEAAKSGKELKLDDNTKKAGGTTGEEQSNKSKSSANGYILESLMYNNQKSWSFWLNGQKFRFGDSHQIKKDLIVLEVGKGGVKFMLTPRTAAIKRKIDQFQSLIKNENINENYGYKINDRVTLFNMKSSKKNSEEDSSGVFFVTFTLKAGEMFSFDTFNVQNFYN